MMKTFSDWGEAPGENMKSEFMSIHDGLLYMAEVGNHQTTAYRGSNQPMANPSTE
jgi:hypothetical protein